MTKSVFSAFAALAFIAAPAFCSDQALDQILSNQKKLDEILANQKQIITKEDEILSNQKTIIDNQEKILKNQETIKSKVDASR